MGPGKWTRSIVQFNTDYIICYVSSFLPSTIMAQSHG